MYRSQSLEAIRSLASTLALGTARLTVLAAELLLWRVSACRLNRTATRTWWRCTLPRHGNAGTTAVKRPGGRELEAEQIHCEVVGAELKENSAAQKHFIGSCWLLGGLVPGEADSKGEGYCTCCGAR